MSMETTENRRVTNEWDFLFRPPIAETLQAILNDFSNATVNSNVFEEHYSALARQISSGLALWTPTPQETATGKPQTPHSVRETIKISTPLVGLGPDKIFDAAQELWLQTFTKPHLVLEQQLEFFHQGVIAPLAGQGLRPEKNDRRFADSQWQDNQFYKNMLQFYLAWTQSLQGFVEKSGADPQAAERMRYVASLLTDALSPSNSLLANPAAAKRAVETNGRSIADGLQNLVTDLMARRSIPEQVDKSAFEPGRNLAITPGAVVFSNDVLELMQYSPATAEVFTVPQLIVPPQLNKYYLFDLSPANSVVAYLVEHGHTVFAVSWRNPSTSERDWNIDTYVAALLEALAVIHDITGTPEVGLVGACTGALTMSALLGYLAAIGDRRVRMATMSVAVLDSNEGAHLGVFATPEAVAASKRKSAAAGVLDGEEIGQVFSWLRPNELVWNYWVNNYLMGNPPPAFDILYWNSDSTRLPAKFHADLLDIFSQDLFRKPGAMLVLGKPIDLSQVVCDLYKVGGMTDHITVWKGVYRSAQLFGGNVTYVLNSSGHIQTILCPPNNPKAKYYLNTQMPADPDIWLKEATAHAGSWWEHWREWLATRAGSPQPARLIGSGRYPAGVRAPGNYVRQS